MTTPIEAGYPKDAPRGTGDTGGQFVTQDSKSQPATKPQPKAAPKGKPQVQHKPAPKKPAPKPGPAARPPGPPGSPRLNLKRGGQNDAGEVRNLQALLSGLKVGNVALDGQFGPGTEAAVKAAQTKLGMKPTGRASSALIRRMADAHALSPCIKKVAAGFDPSLHPHDPADGKWMDTPNLGTITDAYTQLYGDVLDEASAGDDHQYVVAVTEVGDMHLALDDPEGAPRDVFTELTPEEGRSLADELRWAADYRPTGDEKAYDGVIASALVEGMSHVEVWVHHTGDVGIHNVDVAGDPGWDIDPGDAADLADALDKMADFYDDQFGDSPVTAAAGADATPGHDQLHHYWVAGAGLARWRASPTPWTTLVTLLSEHVGPAKAKIFASEWYREVFGRWVGETKGKNPLGPG